MEGVDNGQLRTWVAAWAAEYDELHDAQLTELCGAEHLTRRCMEILIAWKFVAMPHRRARADRALGEEADQAIVDITAAARRCVDDGAAPRVVRTLGGVGSARPDVQAFAGALQGARASKGVFITTSTFSRQAQDFADSLAVRLILVDGDELARLMIEHGVGVTVRQTYELKRVDEDYFAANNS